jgi:hypothetical protein
MKYIDTAYKLLYPYSRRVKVTASCRDADAIPKVEQAGEVIDGLQIMHNGIRIVPEQYGGAWMMDLIRNLRGHHEPQEEKAFYEMLPYFPPGAVMIELGSFWAYYSLWFYRCIEEARVHLIEPNPEKLATGLRNFEINELPPPVATKAAIGATNDEAAGVLCLDEYIRTHALDHVDLVHSDIQGAELKMLKGCASAIEDGRISCFFISTHRGKHARCLAFLRERNYRIVVEHTLREGYAWEGLIVALSEDADGPASVEISRRKVNVLARFLGGGR